MNIQVSIQYYKPLSYPFIKAYIITMRPYLMFVSGITGIAGMSFGMEANEIKLMMIFLACFLSYGFGQALTDCFQTDTDSISSPYRPLTQNLVSKKSFLVTSCIGLIFCVGILGIYNPVNLFLGLLAGTGLATYTFFKRRWWGGPFYNAWIVTVLFFMGYLAASGNKIDVLLFPAAAAVLFAYANFVLSGYFKDIEADRATGYNTLPVVFGRKISVFISDFFALAAIISVLIVFFINNGFNSMPALLFLISGIITSIYSQVMLHKVKTDDEAYKAISPVVHAYLLLLSAMAVSRKEEWILPLLIFYFIYLVVLKLRPSKQQI